MTVQQIRAGGFGPLSVAEPSAEGTDAAAAGGFGALLAALVTPEAGMVPVLPGVVGELPNQDPDPDAEAPADDAAATLAAALNASAFGTLTAPPTVVATEVGLAVPVDADGAVADGTVTAGTAEPGEPLLPSSALPQPADDALATPAPTPLPQPEPSAELPTPPTAPTAPADPDPNALLDVEQPVTAPRAAATNSSEPAPVPASAPAAAPVAVAAPGSSSPLGASAPAPVLSSPGAQVAQPVVAAAVQHLATGQGTSRMTLTLQPEALGEVRVHLSVRDGVVNVRLSAVDAAAQALALDAPELRRMLESIGATDTRVLVSDSNSGQSHLDQRSAGAESGFGEPEGRGQSAESGVLPQAIAQTPVQQSTPISTPVRSSGLDLQM